MKYLPGIIKKSLVLRLILLLLCNNFFTQAFSQHYDIKNISNKDGLPSSSIYRVFEDSKGYMWFLTDKGISRFDGKLHKNFSSKEGFTELFAFHICEDKNGIIWVISSNFKLFYFKNGCFTHYPIADLIGWMDIDPENNIWLLSRSGNVFKIRDDMTWASVIDASTNNPGYVPYLAFSILYLGNGKFLFGNALGVSIIGKGVRPTLLLLSNTQRNQISPRFFRLSGNRIIVATYEGIFQFDTRTQKLSKQFSFINNQVYCSYQSPATGELWIGTFHGIYIFKNGNLGGTFNHVFKEHAVTSIIYSMDHNFWIGTYDKGAFWYNTHAVHLDESDGLKGTVTFLKRENENIYTFSMNEGINKLSNDYKIVPFFSPGINYTKVPSGVDQVREILGAISVNDTLIYFHVGSSRVDLQACKLEYSIVSPK